MLESQELLEIENFPSECYSLAREACVPARALSLLSFKFS